MDDCSNATRNGFRFHGPLVTGVHVFCLHQYFGLSDCVRVSVRGVIRLIGSMVMMSRVGREVSIGMVMVGMAMMLFRVFDRQIDLLLVPLQSWWGW